MHVHFVGVGGKGVSQVAKFFIELQNYYSNIKITASDINNQTLESFKSYINEKKIKIFVPHTDEPVTQNTDFLIVSPAILKFDNPEVKKARKLKIPVIEFSDYIRFLRDEYFEHTQPNELEYWDLSFWKQLRAVWYQNHFKQQDVISAIKKTQLLPFYFADLSDFLLIGVTGTDGKTTTSSMLFHLFKSLGQKVAMITTVEAKIYVGQDKCLSADTGLHQTTPPATEILKYIEKAKRYGVKVIILEVTSHALVQLRIAGLKFDFTVFTNITKEHLDYHRTWERYAYAKLLLVTKHLKQNGVALFNFDDPGTRKAFKLLDADKRDNVLWYGKDSNNILQRNWAIVFRNTQSISTKDLLAQKADFMLNCNGKKVALNKVVLNLLGKYNFYNFASALYAFCLGFKKIERNYSLEKLLAQAKKQFLSFSLPTGRMQVIRTRPLVIVDFAHTPNGLKSALRSIKEFQQSSKQYKDGNIMVIFGTAGERDKSKRVPMGKWAYKFADFIFLTAEDPRREKLYDINMQILEGIKQQAEVDGYSLELVFKAGKFLDSYEKYIAGGKFSEQLELLKNKKILDLLASHKFEIYVVQKNEVQKDEGQHGVVTRVIFNFYEESVSSRKAALHLALLLANKQDIIIATGKAHEQSLAFGLKEYEWNDIKFLRDLYKQDD